MQKAKLRKYMWLVFLVTTSTAISFADDYKDPFRTYNRKIAKLQTVIDDENNAGKKKSEKKIKLYQGKIDTQLRMKRAAYNRLKGKFEKDCHRLKKNIEGRKKFIEKYPTKKKSISDNQKAIAINEERIEKLKTKFAEEVEAFWTDNETQ